MHGQGPWLFLPGLCHCWLWGAPIAPSTLLRSGFSLHLFSKVSALLSRCPGSQSRLRAHRSSLAAACSLGEETLVTSRLLRSRTLSWAPPPKPPSSPPHPLMASGLPFLLPEHPSHLPRPPLCRLSPPGSAGEHSSLSGNIPSTCAPDESLCVLTSESPCQTSCRGLGGSVARVS